MDSADQLIRRYCAQGDQESFRRFYAQEAPKLWKFLVARGCPRDDAYDIVSEAFLRFVTQVCKDPSYPRAFLYRIALNARIDSHRRLQTAGETVTVDALDDVPAELSDPVDQHAVRQGMARLHSDEQDLLLMRYWIGMTHAEIAESLGLPEGTVRRQAAAALHQLRAILEEDN